MAESKDGSTGAAGTVRALKMMAAEYGKPDRLRPYEVDVPAPGPGEVTIDVWAAGVNPTDYKAIEGYRGSEESKLPLAVGREAAGVIRAIGADTEIASGGGAVGDAVVAYRLEGGYVETITAPAADTFAKPDTLDFAEAANLLLVGTTAADMLRVVPVESGQTVVVHGASGAVGVSLLQQLAPLGVRAIGTASEGRFDIVRRFGGEPVTYGDGLEERLREIAPEGYDGAFDCAGTDEAVDASLALAGEDRVVTIVAKDEPPPDGVTMIGGTQPASAAYRDKMREPILALAARGKLVVPIARTFPLREAAAALECLAGGRSSGKLALTASGWEPAG